MRRRWVADGDESRGGARRGLAGEGQSGVPRLGLDRGLAVAHVRDMGDALVALAGLEEVRGGAGSAAAGRRGETRWRARSCVALGTGAVANDHARMRSAQARWNGTLAGSCCATGVLPWRSGGGGTPAAVLCQQSGLRPNWLSAKGGTGLQSAHRGVAVDGVAAQGSRRQSSAAGCGGARGGRSLRRSSGRLGSTGGLAKTL